VTREIVSFLNNQDDDNLEWGYLIKRDNNYTSGWVLFKGEEIHSDTLMAPYPIPSANLIPGCQLDDWTQEIENVLKNKVA
jgi:hypothetical protein